MELDFSRCPIPPFQHQREDVVKVMRNPFFFIASEMRTGKSKIVVDAAQFLFERGAINRVIVVCPAPVRDVWYDPTLGEFAKHLWPGLPARVSRYHAKIKSWTHGTPTDSMLKIIVTNFEFIRSRERLARLMQYTGPKTLLVLDESAFVKSYKSAQTKACRELRKYCGRVVLINGTPIFHSPEDLFSQGNLLHPKILQCPFITHFKQKYACEETVMVGPKGKERPIKKPRGGHVMKVTGWRNLEDLQDRFAPYTVRRLQADCLDLPPKLDPVVLTATLSPATWKVYREMRDEMVAWLTAQQVAVSPTAAVKAMRLSQITSGFVGGLETEDGPLVLVDRSKEKPVHFLGTEKLEVLEWFLERCLEEEEKPKVVAWCRFRAEMFRALEFVQKKFRQFTTCGIHGGQSQEDRLRALSLLKPETSPDEAIFSIGVEGTGSFGLDMTASHTCITLSTGHSPGRVAQTLDRVYGPAQKHPISYHHILSTGPSGQRTIDHVIEEARRRGEDIANWTTSAWVEALQQE